MSCTCTKTMIEVKVVTALRLAFHKTNITPATRFGKELDVDDFVKRGLFFRIKLAVDDPKPSGCSLQELTPDDFVKFKTVRAIINAVVKEFKCTDG
jgi:hypothetical protein